MPIIHLNGQFLERDDAALDPLDRGVLLGDGLFETIRCEAGQLLHHEAHFARLARGARALEIAWNMPPEELLQICQQVLDANGLELARLRVTLTRGELGNSPEIGEPGTSATLIVHAAPFDQARMDAARLKGWTARIVHFPLNHRSPMARIKSTSYQEHLLARLEARRAGHDEGLFLNTAGVLAEGSMTNLFAVVGGEVLTPPVEDGALPGIMRAQVLEACSRTGIPCHEPSLTPDMLRTAEEAFLTNSLVEIMPLAGVEHFPIGTGEPGEVTTRLYREYRRGVEAFLAALRRS